MMMSRRKKKLMDLGGSQERSFCSLNPVRRWVRRGEVEAMEHCAVSDRADDRA